MQATIERGMVEAEHFDCEKRRYYDTVTWLAEVLPGSMRTPFEYRFDGHELYAGDGTAMGEVFDDAIEQARDLPAYELRRRLVEKQEYQDMLRMMSGELPNTMVIESDFPPELMDATEDVGGYNVRRKPTMLRVMTKTPQGTLMMYSQTLDGSNRMALEAIREYLGFDTEPGELLGQRMHLELEPEAQQFLTDRLTGIYDRSLAQQFGGDWYAGRPGERRMNTYDFVCQQADLVAAYLATTGSFTAGQREYNLAAAMKERYIAAVSSPAVRSEQIVQSMEANGLVAQMIAMAEMNRAGYRAQSRGETFSGCGASVETDAEGNAGGAEEQLSEAGYGNKTEEADDYGPLKFKCPKGHWNKRPRAKSPKDFMTHCKTCNISLKC